MRKIYFVLTILVGILFASCMTGKKSMVVPVATNTISTVSFSDLNLDREDYKILNTIEVSSTVTVVYSNNGGITISDDAGYVLKMGKDEKTGLVTTETTGILRAGFLTNDYGNINYENPEAIARATAFSRLISMAKEQGGDALIEPIVSTNLEEQQSQGFGSAKKRTIVYSTTASAKVVVIKTDK